MSSLNAQRCRSRLCAALFGLVILASANFAQADTFRVTFENLQGAGGFTLTPSWVGFHDGAFDTFDVGAAASGSLESLAEVGVTSGLSGDFTAAGYAATDQGVLGQPAGFGGAPLVEPGEIASMLFNTNNDFFSYASMIIPSNDTFIGNSAANAHSVAGLALGQSLTIDVIRFYDAGTEINDPNDGAAFSTTGGGGGTGTAENGVITLADLNAFNATFLNTSTPNGVVTTPLGTPVARFTITSVPEPGSATLIGVFGLGLALFRRRGRS